MTARLICAGLSKHFGALRAVDAVDLEVHAGGRHALIGPNGAGKSTLLQLISGVQTVTGGSVRLAEKEVTSASVARRSRMGVVQTFQHSSLFPSMSALDNVALAVQRGHGVRPWPSRARRQAIIERANELLARMDMSARSAVTVGSLAHGERRQLEIAVALACDPQVLLLDEPAAGMSPAESARLAELIERLPTDVSVLFVEHDLDLVFQLADRVTVLHLGTELLTGTPEEVRASDAVQQAYLGAGAGREDLFFPPESTKESADVPART